MSLDPSRLLSVPNVPTDEIEIVQEEEYTVDKINTAYLVGMAKDILKQDEQVKIPIIYDPDIEEIQVLQPSDLPPLPSFYKKKVHRLIPHKNFPVKIIILILILIFPQFFANDFENRKEECLDLIDTYKVIPGFTWGLAQKEEVKSTYVKLSCDSFLIPPLDTFQVHESLQMIMAAKFNSTVFFRQGDSGSILCEIDQSHDLKIQSKVLIVIYQEMRSFHIAIQYIKLNIINMLLDENVGVSLALCFRSTAHYERDIEDIYRSLNQFGVMEYVILVKFISIIDEERIVRVLNSSITRHNI